MGTDVDAGKASFRFSPSLSSLGSTIIWVGTAAHLSLEVKTTLLLPPLLLVTVFDVLFLLEINGKELGVTDRDDDGMTHNELAAGDEHGTNTDEEHGRMDAGHGRTEGDDVDDGGRTDDEHERADEDDMGLSRSDEDPANSSTSFFSLSALLASLRSARRWSRLATCWMTLASWSMWAGVKLEL